MAVKRSDVLSIISVILTLLTSLAALAWYLFDSSERLDEKKSEARRSRVLLRTCLNLVGREMCSVYERTNAFHVFYYQGDSLREEESYQNNMMYDLSRTDLRSLDLRGLDLTQADLSESNMHGAVLKDAVLSGADMSRAVLSCTDLRRTELGPIRDKGSRASLIRADLRAANLRYSNVIKEQLDYACLDEETILPKGFEDFRIDKTKCVGFGSYACVK